MALNIANCPRCGKVYARGIREVCNACFNLVEEEYNSCTKYLRDNKGATISELSDETGVTIRQITKFIREGRISLYNAPNLSYPCESCGNLIREGAICDVCRTRLNSDVRRVQDEDARRLAEAKQRRDALTYKIDESDKK
jgi:flagellar operon protein (TIGR03826 family)